MFYSGRGFSVYKYRQGGLGGKDERGQPSDLPVPLPGSEEAGKPCALLWVPDPGIRALPLIIWDRKRLIRSTAPQKLPWEYKCLCQGLASEIPRRKGGKSLEKFEA